MKSKNAHHANKHSLAVQLREFAEQDHPGEPYGLVLWSSWVCEA